MPATLNKLIKLRSNLNRLRRDASWLLGINQPYFNTAKGDRILVYHGICLDDHLRFNTLFLKLKTFEAHLQFYKKYFTIVSLDDFYNRGFTNERFTI